MSFSRNPKNTTRQTHSATVAKKPNLEFRITRWDQESRANVTIKKTELNASDQELLETLMAPNISRERINLGGVAEAPHFKIELHGKKTPKVMQFCSKGLYHDMPKEKADKMYETLNEMIDRLAKTTEQEAEHVR